MIVYKTTLFSAFTSAMFYATSVQAAQPSTPPPFNCCANSTISFTVTDMSPPCRSAISKAQAQSPPTHGRPRPRPYRAKTAD
jgi:hypothetical protein